MHYRLRRLLLKIRGYHFVRLIRHEAFDGTPITESIYQNKAGREQRLVVGAWLNEEDLKP